MTTDERLARINGEAILGEPPHYSDAMWLVAELRRAREALRELAKLGERQAIKFRDVYYVEVDEVESLAKGGLGDETS